jgi:hypothetical protein
MDNAADNHTPLDFFATKVDAARRVLELGRSRLERCARRFAELRSVRALAELERAALAFDMAQRILDEKVRAWARVVSAAESAAEEPAH